MIPYYLSVLIVSLFFLGVVQWKLKKVPKKRTAVYQKWILSSLLLALLLPLLINIFSPVTAFAMTGLLALIAGSQLPIPTVLETAGGESKSQLLKERVQQTLAEEKEAEIDSSVDLEPETVKTESQEKKCEEVKMKVPDDGEIVNEPTVKEEIATSGDAETGEALKEALLAAEELPAENETVDVEEKREESEEDAGEAKKQNIYEYLPESLSETLAEILLMDGMIGLEENDLDAAENSLREVCLKAKDPSQRMMAFGQLKIVYGSQGNYDKLYDIATLLAENELMEEYKELILDQAAYLKRIISI